MDNPILKAPSTEQPLRNRIGDLLLLNKQLNDDKLKKKVIEIIIKNYRTDFFYNEYSVNENEDGTKKRKITVTNNMVRKYLKEWIDLEFPDLRDFAQTTMHRPSVIEHVMNHKRFVRDSRGRIPAFKSDDIAHEKVKYATCDRWLSGG